MEQRLADLIGHEIYIIASCECTRVVQMGVGGLLGRLGLDATLDDAKRRLRCRTCKARATIRLERSFATSGGRDRRVNPPPLPDWVAAVVER